MISRKFKVLISIVVIVVYVCFFYCNVLFHPLVSLTASWYNITDFILLFGVFALLFLCIFITIR